MLFVVYVVLLLLCNGFPWNSRKNPKKKQKKRLLVAKKKNKKGSSFLSSSPPLSSESSSFASGASSSSLARSYQRNNRFWKNEAFFPQKEFCVFIPSYYHITRDVAFTLFREYVLLHRTGYCSLCCCWWWSTENDSDVDAFPSLFSKTSTWFSNALVAHERHVFRRKRRRTEEETSGIERKTDRILSRNLPRRRWVFQRPRERRYPQREGSFGNVWCGGKGGGKGLDAKPLERTMEINLHDRVRRDRITRFFGTTTTVAVFSTAANRGWRHLSRV